MKKEKKTKNTLLIEQYKDQILYLTEERNRKMERIFHGIIHETKQLETKENLNIKTKIKTQKVKRLVLMNAVKHERTKRYRDTTNYNYNKIRWDQTCY